MSCSLIGKTLPFDRRSWTFESSQLSNNKSKKKIKVGAALLCLASLATARAAFPCIHASNHPRKAGSVAVRKRLLL